VALPQLLSPYEFSDSNRLQRGHWATLKPRIELQAGDLNGKGGRS
jgi:hypothetical protein